MGGLWHWGARSFLGLMQIMKHSIIDDEELLVGARAIAADLRVGDTRQLKLARIIDAHLHWFQRARQRGLEWTDIVGILFEVGVTRPDGRPLSRGHLSALVWRKQKSAAVQLTTATTLQPAPRDAIGSKRAGDGRSEVPTSDARSGGGRASDQPASSTLTSGDNAKGKPESVDEGSTHASVRAYMRRAARLRRNE